MPTAIDFAKVRPLFGGKLKQSQVDGINGIIVAWDQYGDGNIQRLAYVLATAFHETAATMQPIREYGKGKGKKYSSRLWLKRLSAKGPHCGPFA